jgi:hypothetical protein
MGKKIVLERGPDSVQGVMAGCCEHSNEVTGYVYGGVFHGLSERLSACKKGVFFVELISWLR